MLVKIKNFIIAHLVQSIALSIVVIASIVGTSYLVSQKADSSDNIKDSTSKNSAESCAEVVRIGLIAVEEDPTGNPEAWLRFDYTSTASQPLNCQYSITFYDNQETVIRTIADTEDTFQVSSGQIYNGYSSTPYQTGMTAQVIIK